MAARGGSDRGDGGPREAARYLAEAAADLAILARRHRLDMLSYLLEMAQLEAQEVLRRNGPSSN